jgi:hypothetical protein
MTKGERKNQPCNRKVAEDSNLCKIHKTLEDKRPYNPYVDKECDFEERDDEFVSKLGILEKERISI